MKIIATLTLLFIGLFAFAQNTSMTIFNNSGQQFFVIMNGIRQNSIPKTNVKIGGMTTGAYEIKLIFADGKTGDINKKIWIDVQGDYLARVDMKGKKAKLKWFGIPDPSMMPAGGNDIQYRPNDQSVYSDQSVVSNGSSNGQYGTQNGQTSYSTQQTQTGQGTYQQTGQETYQTQTGQAQQTGTTNGGTVNTGTTISDPNASGGQVTMNTNVSVTDPAMNGGVTSGGMVQTTTSGNQSGNVTTGTTVNDPMNGQFGMNVNINITDPTTNGGMGGVQMTTTSTDGSGQAQTMTTGTTITDPTMNGGHGGVNVNVSGTGMPSGTGNGAVNSSSSSTVTTSSSSTVTQNGQVIEDSYNYQQTASNTQNGQTTTQTTEYGYGNGQPAQTGGSVNYGTQGTTTYNGGGSYETQGTVNTQTSNGGYYNCTSVLTDVDGFVAKINTKDFEADKRELIESSLRSQCVSADQAYRVVNALTFEADRLDMSKFLYDRMTDKVNGKRLLELLEFDMDKEELTEYMTTH